MQVWRLCKQKYASTAFDGEGALRAGGRWNSRGKAVAYTSESLALASLELLVHIISAELWPTNLVAISAQIPDDLVATSIEIEDMPKKWRSTSGHPALKSRGNKWIDGRETCAMAVPSVIVPEERNILLNPAHPAFKEISIGEPRPFTLDSRFSPDYS